MNKKNKYTKVRNCVNIDTNIIHRMLKKTLRSYGNVKSMNSKERFPKTITNWKPPGKENRRRPQKKIKGKFGKDHE